MKRTRREYSNYKILVIHDKTQPVSELMESSRVLGSKFWTNWYVDEIPYHGDLKLNSDGLVWAINRFSIPSWLVKKFPNDGFNQLWALSNVEYAPIKYIEWFKGSYDSYKQNWHEWIENKNPEYLGSDDEYEKMKNGHIQKYLNADNYARTENARYFNYVITSDGRFFSDNGDPYWGSNFYEKFIKTENSDLMCTVVHCYI